MKIKNFETRRSIRQYSEEIISQEALHNILEAALHTPTTNNLQQFKLVVIERGSIPAADFAAMTYGQPHTLAASHIIMIFTLKRTEISREILEAAFSYLPHEQREASVQRSLPFYKEYTYDLPGTGYAVALSMALEADANGVGSTIFAGFDKHKAAQVLHDKVDTTKYEATLGISLGIKSPNAVIFPRNSKKIEEVVSFVKK